MSIIFILPKLSWNDSAYGLNYESGNENINILQHGDYTKDSLETINILQKWKDKNSDTTGFAY